jgi:hypothetical protein
MPNINTEKIKTPRLIANISIKNLFDSIDFLLHRKLAIKQEEDEVKPMEEVIEQPEVKPKRTAAPRQK